MPKFTLFGQVSNEIRQYETITRMYVRTLKYSKNIKKKIYEQ